jgi:hypothetical protein
MEYIALEECFGIPELAARRSGALSGIRLRPSYMSEVRSPPGVSNTTVPGGEARSVCHWR